MYIPALALGCAMLAIYICTYDLYGPVRIAFDAGGQHQLRGQVQGGWALDFETFLGPVKWHRADRRVPFGAQKSRSKYIGCPPPPLMRENPVA
jgi:hypothetical protein